MKKLILQHWTGEMNELSDRSSANISKYAKRIGADYKLLRGNVFHPTLSPPCQKLYMLDEVFDEYDMVVMLDADMFIRKGMNEDVFEDVEGIGRHTEIQDRLMLSMKRKHNKLTNPEYPYWGGSIYRLDRNLRQRLRAHIKEEELLPFSGNFEDEGIMHRLATLAQFEITENTYLPGNHWNRGSFEEGVELAAIIHIRTKITPTGPKRTKIENYRDLVQRGIIEE
jgi:hypothetical protein